MAVKKLMMKHASIMDRVLHSEAKRKKNLWGVRSKTSKGKSKDWWR
jgi:hypothetical protein